MIVPILKVNFTFYILEIRGKQNSPLKGICRKSEKKCRLMDPPVVKNRFSEDWSQDQDFLQTEVS